MQKKDTVHYDAALEHHRLVGSLEFLLSQPLRDETSIEAERRYRRDPEIGGIGVEWVQQDISFRRGGIEGQDRAGKEQQGGAP